jgi:hypothetical protein
MSLESLRLAERLTVERDIALDHSDRQSVSHHPTRTVRTRDDRMSRYWKEYSGCSNAKTNALVIQASVTPSPQRGSALELSSQGHLSKG